MKKLRLFEMFAGYGGASFGLKKAGIPFECVGYSEIDKYAIECFEQNHKGKNFGDCSKIDLKDLQDFDLLTGGFPCQDVSIAGKRDLNKGRTNLYEEILRIAKDKKPKFMLLENVKGLLSMKVDEVKLHQKIIRDLQKLGYGVCWKVLNSKDYGVPQNRERIWFVCKLGGWNFMEFQFPNKEELKIFLKDILEKKVKEKYNLTEKQIKSLMKGMQKSKINPKIAGALQSPGHSSGNYRGMNMIMKINNPKHSKNRVYLPEGVSPTLSTMQGGGLQPFIVTHSLYPRSGNPKQGGTGHLSKSDGVSYCIDTGNCQAIEYSKRIRRLTPKECFRLMGFLDDEVNIDGLSDTQKYKLAGNGWDVNLVSKILKKMFKTSFNL